MIVLGNKISSIVKFFENIESNKNNSYDKLISVKNTSKHNIHNTIVKNTIGETTKITFKNNKSTSSTSPVSKEITTKNNIGEIDILCNTLENFTLKMKSDDSKNNPREKTLLRNYSDYKNQKIITIKKSDDLGHGSYGHAYRIDNFVIKIYHDVDFENENYADPERCSRILNETNKDSEFSRSITLNNGNKILVTKFIDGTSIEGKEAREFVESRGRIIFDCDSNGNVIKDKSGKLYLIDADLVAMPTGRSRTLSIGTTEIHHMYKDIYHDPKSKERYFNSFHHKEIKYLL